MVTKAPWGLNQKEKSFPALTTCVNSRRLFLRGSTMDKISKSSHIALFCLMICLLTLTSPTWANETFWQQLVSSQSACLDLNCPNSLLRKQNLTNNDWRNLDRTTRRTLLQMAREQIRDLWPDTVLEGDLYAIANVRIDATFALVAGQNLLEQTAQGYWVIFSVEAWDLTTCQIDRYNRQELNKCEKGRIREAFYVDAQLTLKKADPYLPAFYYQPE